MVDSLKALDPNRPIREADITERRREVRFVPFASLWHCKMHNRSMCQIEALVDLALNQLGV